MAIRRELGRRVRFELERLLVRGTHVRFLLVLAVIGVASLVGGLAVRGTDEQSLGAEVWWAFLRLTDPGYLGDDVGLWRRIVSTALTIAGYVVFLGAMVAILTQWLNDTLERLEAGLTPVRMNGHIVVLGWTPSVRAICGNLVRGESRLTRWLQRQGVSRLQVAVLAPEVNAERLAELADGMDRDERRASLVLRSGSPLRRSHLRRVDVRHAACVVIPGVEGTSVRAEDYDPTVLKVLRTIALDANNDEDLPTCVCEILDARRIPLARRAYPGPLEVVASDVFVGRLLAESLRNPGVAAVCAELLTHGEGATLYMLDWKTAAMTLAEAQQRLHRATIVGVVADGRFTVAPPEQMVVEPEASLVVVARQREDLVVSDSLRPVMAPAELAMTRSAVAERRVLVLGWNRRVVDLVEGLRERPDEPWRIDVLSVVEAEERHELVPEADDVRQLRGDPTLPSALTEVDLQEYDRIVLLAGALAKSDEEADARTIATFLGLEEVLPDHRGWPPVTIELLGRDDDELLDGARVEVVDGARLVSLAIAQIVLRRELHAVVDDIFGTGGSSIEFVHPKLAGTTRFGAAAAAVRSRGAVAIGIRRGGLGGALELLPDPDAEVDRAAGDELVLVAGPELDV